MFDPLTMWECDWTQTDVFKQKITALQQQGYRFISLPEAYEKIKHDTFRLKKYAVLTADDGGNCILNLMPWLADRSIPITLFLPAAYIYGEIVEHKCGISLSISQVNKLIETYKTLITIANHSYSHIVVSRLAQDEFEKEVVMAKEKLESLQNVIPFYAYPCGEHNNKTDLIVRKRDMIPVYADGAKNYNNFKVIHRELL